MKYGGFSRIDGGWAGGMGLGGGMRIKYRGEGRRGSTCWVLVVRGAGCEVCIFWALNRRFTVRLVL